VPQMVLRTYFDADACPVDTGMASSTCELTQMTQASGWTSLA